MNSDVFIPRLGSLVTFMTLVLLFVSPAKAQTFSSVTDGSTPSALTPGAQYQMSCARRGIRHSCVTASRYWGREAVGVWPK